MKLKVNFVSSFQLILVFTFQSRYTVGQSGGNGAQSKVVPEANPSIDAGSVQEPREKYVAKSLVTNDVKGEITSRKGDDTRDSMEKEHTDDDAGDGSSSSSSSSSEESGPYNTYTTSKPNANGSSSALGKKIKLTKMDTTRLVKPRDAKKKDNWYAFKRSTNSNINGKVRNQTLRQRQRQNGRNGGGAAEEDGGQNQDPNSKPLGPIGHKPVGPLGHHKPGGKDPFGNNKDSGGQTANPLINKTSIKPFNVQRTNRPVDPNVYSFFQFKPSESIGFLWTQSAGLGNLGMQGRIDEMLENDEATDEDDLDPAIVFDWEFRRYDRACLYVEYTVYKAQMNSTQVSEEISRMVDGQNEQLARRFLDWQFINKEDHETIALKGEGENHPQYLTYKFLTMTMEIFRDKICRNATPYATSPEIKPFAPASAQSKAEANKKYIDSKLLPKSFVDDIFRLFLTLRDITLPKGVPDYASKKDEEDIYTDVLENCLKLDPIQWFSHTCADQVLSYDDPHNYACTPLVEYDYNYKEYDPILDGMWHMFTAVHAYCFEEFNKRSMRLWHKYSMIIANSYTVGMRARWKASIAEPKFYRRLLGPDHKTHLETMNRCMFAATLRSGAPAVLPRFLSVSPVTFQKERAMAKDGSENHPKK